MKNIPIPEVYVKPNAPRSNGEIIKWLFIEPTLLDRWARENQGNYWKDTQKILFIYCFYFTPIFLGFWIFLITGLVWADVPVQFPEIFEKKNEANAWLALPNFASRWLFLYSKLAFSVSMGWTCGLVSGLLGTVKLNLRLYLMLVIGLASGLLFGLSPWLFVVIIGLVFGLFFVMNPDMDRDYDEEFDMMYLEGLAFGLAVGLTTALTFGLVAGLFTGLAEMLERGFTLGLSVGLNAGLSVGKVAGLSSMLTAFIGIFIPFNPLQFHKGYTLLNNPYLRYELIKLHWRLLFRDLRQHAKQEPELAFHFVDFLLRYRPLQRVLAFELEHIATAALWRSDLRLYSHIFEREYFLKDELSTKWEKFTPSSTWREKILELRETLRSVEATTAIVAQQSLLQSCDKLIEEFEAINLRESFRGREEYFSVIEHWKQVLNNQLQEVAQHVAASQAITLNPYSKGNALTPTLAASSPLFLDRTDIREELSLKIQTSAIMPTFLILGQRRVGKTSLLNFLPRLLDPNLYDVVVVDAQGLAGESSLLEWLKFWRRRIERQLRLPSSVPEMDSSPLQAWDQFATFLDDLTQKRQRRLILAMDEYDEERGLHYAIRQDPKFGAALLGRMRAFAQRQKMVVFLFVGASYFSDLPEPKWSKYFVQTHIVRVDYLSEAASMQLIELPVPNFALRYASGVAEQIYQLTQGHPHLLHSICSDLVDYANVKVKNPVEQSDLDYILQHNIVLRGEQPFSVFWDEFCETEAMRKVVVAIAFGQTVDAQQAEVRKLADYGYIVADGNDGYRMRVPLFADWVRQFGY